MTIDGVTQSFDTFEEALAAANGSSSPSVIKLANPVETSSRMNVTRSMTIDLNGQELTSGAGNILASITNGATLTINGTKRGSKVVGCISIGASPNNNGNVVLNGGTYECAPGNTCLHINGTCLDSSVTIKNANIVSPDDNAIQLNGSGTFVLQDSTFVGATGVYIKSGNVRISGCTITGNMEPANYSYYGNGANATGDGIVIDSCDYPGGAPVVTISGRNIITGTKAAIGYYEYDGNHDGEVAHGTVRSNYNGYSVPDGFKWEADGSNYKLVPSV